MLADNELTELCERLDRQSPPFLLDARARAAFERLHLRGAVCLPGTAEVADDAAALERRLPSILLPPRHQPLLVMAATPELAQGLARALAARGRARVSALSVDAADLERLPPRLVERGASDRTLWAAPTWLTDHSELLPPPVLGPALDLGCGSGRAAVWLAVRGWRVTGLDRQPEALKLMERLASSRGVRVSPLPADLRRAEALPAGPWAVVVNVRCLERAVLERLHRVVMPHGVVVVRTFREAPGLGPDIRAAHRLRPAELPATFAAARWQVLAHEEGFDDDGSPAAGIVARRRPDDDAAARTAT